MKVIFNNQYELLEGIAYGRVTFKDQESARDLVNAICKACLVEDEDEDTNPFCFYGHSEAWDIDEWCKEVLEFHGWDVDWFDVVTMSIDSNELCCYIKELHNFPYSHNDAVSNIDDIMITWKESTLKYFKKQL
jgi:hypothetical protein